MKVDKEVIGAGLIFVIFIASLGYVLYDFGVRIRTRTEKKSYIDSLKMENLKLEIEIKKHKLKQ